MPPRRARRDVVTQSLSKEVPLMSYRSGVRTVRPTCCTGTDDDASNLHRPPSHFRESYTVPVLWSYGKTLDMSTIVMTQYSRTYLQRYISSPNPPGGQRALSSFRQFSRLWHDSRCIFYALDLFDVIAITCMAFVYNRIMN